MSLSFAELHSNVDELKVRVAAWFAGLAPDRVPSRETLEAGFALREEFESVRREISETLKDSSVAIEAEVGELESCEGLKALLEAIESAEREKDLRLQTAVDALEAATRLIPVGAPSAGFADLTTRASELLRNLRAAESAEREDKLLSDAAEEIGVFSALVRMLTEQALPDEQWDELREAVAQRFGREISAAAARGRLRIGPPVDSAQPSSRPSLDDNSSPEEVSVSPDTSVPSEQPAAASLQTVSTPLTSEHESSSTPPVTNGSSAPPPEPATSVASKPFRAAMEIALDMDSRKIASRLLEHPSEQTGPILSELAWQLIVENHLSLGTQIFRLAEALGDGDASEVPPSWAIRSAVLAPQVSQPAGDIASKLGSNLRRIDWTRIEQSSAEYRDCVRLLVAAAALRPSVVAPIATTAPSILESIYQVNSLARLYDLCKEVAKVTGRLFAPLDPGALKGVRNRAAWQEQIEELQNEVEDWSSRAAAAQIVYAPATRVWRAWIDKHGVIGRMLGTVRENRAADLEEVHNALAQLQDEKRLGKLIQDTHRRLHPQAITTIEARALRRLQTHVSEACNLSQRWLDLQRLSPDSPQKFEVDLAFQLRQISERIGEPLLLELQHAVEESHSRALSGALLLCRAGVHGFQELFDPKLDLYSKEPPARHLVQAELLLVPGLHLDDNWEITGEPCAALKTIIGRIADGLPRWRESFDAFADQRDHQATGRILEYLEFWRQSDARELRTLREQRMKECREALRRDVEQARQQLEDAVALGLIREDDRTRLAATIESLDQSIDSIERFSVGHDLLERLREEITRQRDAEVQRARARLEKLAPSLQQGDVTRISRLLDASDVFTATEYLDMLEAGGALPAAIMPERAFTRFFPAAAESILNFLEHLRRTDIELIDLIRSQKGITGVPMNNVPGAQARAAAEMLNAWFEIKRTQRIQEETALALLRNLGFSPATISIPSGGRRGAKVELTFDQQPIHERERCPVPAFGSMAGGHYRVVCIWQRLTDDALLDEVGDTSHGVPPIVLYFNRMTEKVRRDLARNARARRRCFAILDEVLVIFLCGERGSRLRTFFDCSLPFTRTEPYVTTASYVPPEVFYGRERERELLQDPMGSSFIYGGRQLGKTALLREVERSFHSPEHGRVAFWLDLKTSGIGIDKPLDDLFTLLANNFRQLGVIPTSTPQNAGPDTILDHIAKWLNADRTRRILLLLDEADRFLEQDAQRESGGYQFLRADRLKGLMDRSERRFKVVFAGLHNVQRTTKLANHPLAHFGEPICIGPLLDDGQWKDARRLVEEPLAAIGYEFEHQDLVMRILSQTNYYPSWIQLYCTNLLRHLLKIEFNPNRIPPFRITASHLEDVYRSRQLRDAIRDRFLWTLQLDLRYQVIAFSIALYRNDESLRESGGFSVEHIFREATLWWPDGFKDIGPQDAFRSLLDEMVAFGVLRVDGNGNYGLRSPSVAFMIGTEEEIETILENFADRAPIPEYEPGTFRALYAGDLRSPLTAQQESELRARRNGVAIVCGSEAAGLDAILSFLEATPDPAFLTTICDAIDEQSFRRSLTTVLNARPSEEGVMLTVVPTEAPWTPGWVEVARALIQKRIGKRSHSRVIFLADPSTVWRLLLDGYNLHQQRSASTLVLQSLGPWAEIVLRYWLDDRQIATPALRAQIDTVSGRWPFLIEVLQQRVQSGDSDWSAAVNHLRAEQENPETARRLLKSFGIDDPSVAKALATVCEFGLKDEISELAEVAEVDVAILENALKFAQTLSFGKFDPAIGFKLDDTVARLLTGAGYRLNL